MTVEEIMLVVIPRLNGATPTCSIFDAVRGVQTIIVNLLLTKRSHLVKQLIETSYTAADSSIKLPVGYASMAELPVVDGTTLLAPLKGPVSGDMLTAGDPKWYDVIGKALSIFPPPVSEVSLQLRAYVRPDVPTAMDDDIPFQGAFDEVYAYGAQAVIQAGAAILADRSFVAMIETQVNGVLQASDLSDEQLLADAINFSN